MRAAATELWRDSDVAHCTKPEKTAEKEGCASSMPALTLGSLFDGIGGFPLAALRNGIRPVWASEIEAFPISVTRRHFPDMRHVGDITKLDGTRLSPVDILCGGSPCQDLSLAGARAGLAGARSGLFMEQIRIAREMRDADIARGRTDKLVRPRIFLWENVHDAYVTVSVRSRSYTRIFRLAAENSSTCMVECAGAFSSGQPKGEDFRIVLEETCRIVCDGVSIPRPYTGAWRPAGQIVLGDAFSLAWRVLISLLTDVADTCTFVHICQYEQM